MSSSSNCINMSSIKAYLVPIANIISPQKIILGIIKLIFVMFLKIIQ